ncbi:MAG: hypothetical protein ACE5KZ_01755 [Candidatus Scalinduaceae bacterium]
MSGKKPDLPACAVSTADRNLCGNIEIPRIIVEQKRAKNYRRLNRRQK